MSINASSLADMMPERDVRVRSGREAFLRGVRAVAPLLIGIFPFAMISGTSAMDLGFSIPQTLGLSLIVFAGAAQLAVLDLIDRGTPVLILMITALVINLRFVIYSIGLAPRFKRLGFGWKALVAYLLTDQAYLVSDHDFETEQDLARRKMFFLGAATSLWVTWQAGTATGILFGAAAPESWSLDFAVPLSFIALLAPALKDRSTVIAALAAAGSLVLTDALPFNLGLIAATFIGILAGLVSERRS